MRLRGLVVALLFQSLAANSWCDNILRSGECLTPNQALVSTGGQYKLVFQGDGNLVLYDGNQGIWSSGTSGSRASLCVLRQDGNLVLLDPQQNIVWQSRTDGRGVHSLSLQDDRNLVLYGAEGGVWSTATSLQELANAQAEQRAREQEDSAREQRRKQALADLATQMQSYNQQKQQAATQQAQLAQQQRVNQQLALEAQQREERLRVEQAPIQVPQQAQSAFVQNQPQQQVTSDSLQDIAIVYGRNPVVPPGFKLLDVDLNQGAKGEYIYLCCKFGQSTYPIVDLHAFSSSSANPAAPPSYEIIRSDLNKGAGGKYVFLCYRRSSTEPGISELNVRSHPNKNTALMQGWADGYAMRRNPYRYTVDQDLNEGAKGNYIYLHFNRHNEPVPK